MKLFRPKAMRRCLLFMALIFPVVYLCGGLFSALYGSHGNITLAEPVYVDEFIEVDNFAPGYSSYRLVVDDADSVRAVQAVRTTRIVSNGSYTLNGYSRYTVDTSYGSLYSLNTSEGTYNDLYTYPYSASNPPFPIFTRNGTFSLPLPWVFEGTYDVLNPILNYFGSGSLYVLSSVPSSTVVESPVSFSDYLFSQPFASNNFISDLGSDVISGTAQGFAPMNSLFRYVNDSVMHFTPDNSMAVFGFGYVYYAVNVLIIYEIVILATKLIMLPLRAVDMFDKEGE